MTTKTSAKQQDFEKALERLEAVVAAMEDGSLSLDKMMANFEEGMALVKFCSARLNEVEKRIEILLKKGAAAEAEEFQIPEDASNEKPLRGGEADEE